MLQSYFIIDYFSRILRGHRLLPAIAQGHRERPNNLSNLAML